MGSASTEAAPTALDSSFPASFDSPLFRSVVTKGGMLQSNLCRSAASFFGPELDSRKIVAKKSVLNEDGCPVISFSDDEINKLSSP